MKKKKKKNISNGNIILKVCYGKRNLLPDQYSFSVGN